MADQTIDPVKDGSLYIKALSLGLQAGTPQFYEFIDRKAGKGTYAEVPTAKDIGLTDRLLDVVSGGKHLRESRELYKSQQRADEIYGVLEKTLALDELAKQSSEREVNSLVPPTYGGVEGIQPGLLKQLGYPTPMTQPQESLGFNISPPDRPLPTRIGSPTGHPPLTGFGGNPEAVPTPPLIMPPRSMAPPTLGIQPATLQPRPDLESPVPPLMKQAVIKAVGTRAGMQPVKQSGKQKSEDFLHQYYLETGDIDGLERLGGTRESIKDEAGKAKAFGDVLKEGGIEPGSPEWKSEFREFAKTMRTPTAGTTVNIDTQVKASEEAQKEQMKSTRTTFDQLKHAPVLLENIDKAKALIPKAKGFMGTGGETMLEAAKFLNNRIGTKIDTTGVKSAEELRSRIFFNIMDNLKKMDAQPSQMQQQIMMDSLGKLGTDPTALENVLDAYGDTIRGKVDLHNTEVEGAVKRGVKFPYDPTVKLKPKAQPYVEFRVDKQGRKLGKKADGTVEIIK